MYIKNLGVCEYSKKKKNVQVFKGVCPNHHHIFCRSTFLHVLLFAPSLKQFNPLINQALIYTLFSLFLFSVFSSYSSYFTSLLPPLFPPPLPPFFPPPFFLRSSKNSSYFRERSQRSQKGIAGCYACICST